MPGVVQPSVPEPGVIKQGLPFVVVGVGVEGAAVRLGEDPSFVVSERAGGDALGFLPFPVGIQQFD